VVIVVPSSRAKIEPLFGCLTAAEQLAGGRLGLF